jgi:uncharacterized protein YaaR (DUF327 family)
MEQSVMEDDIVSRIDKLILGWEREYGITNKTMVDAMLTIIDLRSKIPGYDDLHTIIEKQEEEIHMLRAQCLIRKDMIEKLKSGPGGIMEMKQTIADLEKYRNLVEFIANDYIELSYEKAQCQRDDWRKRCNKLIKELNNGI